MGEEYLDLKSPEEIYLEQLLEYYDGFIDSIIEQYSLKISDNVKNKNRTLYKTFVKAAHDSDFRTQLGKNFTLVHDIKPSFLSLFIPNNRTAIEKGEIFAFPIFEQTSEDEKKVKTVLFLKRKDTHGDMGEKVRGLLEKLLGGKSPLPQGT